MKKRKISFPKDVTVEEIDDAIASLVEDGSLKKENADEIRKLAVKEVKNGKNSFDK